MTDIRKMSDEQLTQLNQNKVKKKENKMANKSVVLGEKSPTKKAPFRNPEPAWKSINEASDEEVQEALGRLSARNEFTQNLSRLGIGKGLKVEGDFKRLYTSANIFGRNNGKKFIVSKSKDAGFVLVVRSDDPVAQAPQPAQSPQDPPNSWTADQEPEDVPEYADASN